MPDNSLPGYDKDLFTNRKDELKLVARTLARLSRSDEPQPKRIILFYGNRGSGKSWLIQHLPGWLIQQYPFQSAAVDLAKFTSEDIDTAIINIQTQLLIQLVSAASVAGLPIKRPYDGAQLLERYLAAIVGNMPIVVFFDSVYDSNPEFLVPFEDHVLGILARQPKVMLVLTGRGRRYRWRIVGFRRLTVEHELTHFDTADAEQQLENFRGKQLLANIDIDEILRLSDGHPLSTTILAMNTDFSVALEQIIRSIMDMDLDLKTNLQVGNRPLNLRQATESLAVIEEFTEDEMVKLINVDHFNNTPQQLDHKMAVQIRSRLVAINLAFASGEGGYGYRLDDRLRTVLSLHLQMQSPSRFTTLHRAARDHFAEWTRDFPDEANLWGPKAASHQNILDSFSSSTDGE